MSEQRPGRKELLLAGSDLHVGLHDVLLSRRTRLAALEEKRTDLCVSRNTYSDTGGPQIAGTHGTKEVRERIVADDDRAAPRQLKKKTKNLLRSHLPFLTFAGFDCCERHF